VTARFCRSSFNAAIIALAGSHAAWAGVARRTFHVGASVVASARISCRTTPDGATVEVRVATTRSAAPALLVNGRAERMEGSAAFLPGPRGSDPVVTVVY
jgi:hypothetical protein